MADQHRVVIVGGGFGGLTAALHLKRAPVQVTLIDRRNYHLFQPLLYQVATGALSPANIASPLRHVLRHQKNARVLMAEVTHIDAGRRTAILSDAEIPFDTLIVATGASHQYFGHDEWEQYAPGLKTIEDATEMRRRILLAFEAAEREQDPAKARAWLTFVVVGAGPTGVELAGALGEIANDTLKHDFRAIDPSSAHIILVEGTDRVLPLYPSALSEATRKMLGRLGVTVRTGAMVMKIEKDSVTIREGDHTETIPTRTTLWAAGVLASPLGRILAAEAGATLDKVGRAGSHDRVTPRNIRDWRPLEFQPSDRPTASWSCSARHSAGTLCRGGDCPAAARRKSPALPLCGPGKSSDNWTGRGGCGSRWAAAFRFAGLDGLAFCSPDLYCAIPESLAYFRAVGLAVSHPRPVRALDYGQKRTAALSRLDRTEPTTKERDTGGPSRRPSQGDSARFHTLGFQGRRGGWRGNEFDHGFARLGIWSVG
jgi:NADH dehydrogenase FAD-containing subunit